MPIVWILSVHYVASNKSLFNSEAKYNTRENREDAIFLLDVTIFLLPWKLFEGNSSNI